MKPTDYGPIYVVKSGDVYWAGTQWVSCQTCAERMAWREAHRQAHVLKRGRVVRVVRVIRQPTET